MRSFGLALIFAFAPAVFAGGSVPPTLARTMYSNEPVVLEAGHESLAEWILPATPPAPEGNLTTPERVALGKQLFFDPRLSGSGQVTCASCHLPERGWADGLPTAVRFQGQVMRRATPALVNSGYNPIQMWDGKRRTLEDQGLGGQGPRSEINAGTQPVPGLVDGLNDLAEGAKRELLGGHGYPNVIKRLDGIAGYREAFARAYPGEGVNETTVAKAISAFERSLISRDSPFDRWVAGDRGALGAMQVNGLRLFLDPDKGNCVACHHPPNFTDNGFHNIGLASFGASDHDRGRGGVVDLPQLDGAFKTPTLRDVALSRPYFHDGSAATLEDVVRHYVEGGKVRTNLSPALRVAPLSVEEQRDLVAFLGALTTATGPFVYPVLPR